MSEKSGIEWTEYTVNFYMGCAKVSEGCDKCYMFRMEKRWGRDPTKLRKTNWANIERKLRRIEPSLIFGNSMTDMFIEELSLEQIKEMFDVMEKYPQHTFQILTKRAYRIPKYCEKYKIPDNVWLGVSVELTKYLNRIDYLRLSNAKVKFVSFEPLLGNLLDMNLDNIDWVIVGGESDQSAPRETKESWILNILDKCREKGIPFFFKQWGGKTQCKCHKTWGCRILINQTFDEMPKSFEKELSN